jgi:HEPN domain-containing protein
MERQQSDLPANSGEFFDVYMSKAQIEETEQMLTALKERYNLAGIICFSCLNHLEAGFSCFTNRQQQNTLHFHFLVITNTTPRVEHEIQDYISNHYKSFFATVLAHSLQTVETSIAQGNRFFVEVCQHGVYYYKAGNLFADVNFPKLNPYNTLEKAERRYHDRSQRASGFLEAGSAHIIKGIYHENAVFMLHQAVEQACVSMIKVWLGYRVDIHNLSRLLSLTTTFSNKPTSIFLNDDKEKKRLFEILQRSYGEARYQDHYKVERDDADNLMHLVADFITLADDLCLEWIDLMRSSINPKTEETEITQET